MTIYVTTSQAIVNPANCAAPDGYELNDPAIAQGSLATALTALAAGLPVQFYVSSTQCVGSRPMILDFQIS